MHKSRYMIIIISQHTPIPFLIPYTHLSTAPRENRHNITPAFPKGNRAWESIWGRLGFLSLWLFLSTACYTGGGMCFWKCDSEGSTPVCWKLPCFNDFMANCPIQLCDTKCWNFKIKDLPSKLFIYFNRLTYILYGLNRNTLYILHSLPFQNKTEFSSVFLR